MHQITLKIKVENYICDQLIFTGFCTGSTSKISDNANRTFCNNCTFKVLKYTKISARMACSLLLSMAGRTQSRRIQPA